MPGGRPTSLTPALQAELCELMAEGMYLEPSCDLVGVAPKTVYEWLKRGEEGEEPFADFRNALSMASAKAERESLKAVRTFKNWQGPACFLERRHRARWGRDAQTDASQQQPPQVVVVQVPMQQPQTEQPK